MTLQSRLDAASHCVNYCEQLPLHCVNLGFLAFLSLAFLRVTRLQFAPWLTTAMPPLNIVERVFHKYKA